MKRPTYEKCATCDEIWLSESLDENHICPPCRGICISCNGPYEERWMFRAEVKEEKIIKKDFVRIPYCKECCPKPTYSYGFYYEEIGSNP